MIEQLLKALLPFLINTMVDTVEYSKTNPQVDVQNLAKQRAQELIVYVTEVFADGVMDDKEKRKCLSIMNDENQNDEIRELAQDQLLKNQLLNNEGFVPHAYQDHLGYWTIGVGRLIHKEIGGKITMQEAMYLLQNDIEKYKKDVRRVIPFFNDLDPVRQIVLTGMCFNMGASKLAKFKKMIAALKAKEWHEAKNQALDSKWAKQVKGRAERNAETLRTGILT